MILLRKVSTTSTSHHVSFSLTHCLSYTGRMLNRFGKDIETIDTSLAGSMSSVNSSLATFGAAIITVA